MANPKAEFVAMNVFEFSGVRASIKHFKGYREELDKVTALIDTGLVDIDRARISDLSGWLAELIEMAEEERLRE